MSQITFPYAFGGKDFDRFFIGFDDQVARMMKMHEDITKNVPNYPPYNVRKISDNKYQIELAVAGFGKQDIEVEFTDNKLIVKGNTSSEATDAADYLYKGVGMRAFTRTFAVEDHIEVQSAELVNGMLKVVLEKLIPEHKKSKKIKVKSHDYTTETEV